MKTTVPCKIRYSKPTMSDENDVYAIPLEPGVSFALWLRNHQKSHTMSQADVAEKTGLNINDF